MRILKLTPFVALTMLFLGASAYFNQAAAHGIVVKAAQKKDKVIATKSITGTLKGFEVGDYTHAVIKLANGKEKTFFIGSAGVDYFLALHKGESLVLTYQIVDAYIPEAGGKMRIERLSGAKAGTLTSAAWWKQMRAKHSIEQLDKMYADNVEKLRLNP